MAVYSQYYLRLIQKQDSTVFAEATVAPTKPHDTRHPTHPTLARHGMHKDTYNDSLKSH